MIVPIFLETFVIKPVYFVDILTLVISSKNSNPVLVPALQSQDQRKHLYTVIASIDVISHEKVIGVLQVSLFRDDLTGGFPPTLKSSIKSWN
jgi:hypothetical protein